jgi:hypothetical protein
VIDALRTVVKTEEKMKNNMVHQISGVATTTLDNWFNGSTRRPQNSTIAAVSSALGYLRREYRNKDGSVGTTFVKDQTEIDYEKEIEKQDAWLTKHGLKPDKRKKKKRAKANGHG